MALDAFSLLELTAAAGLKSGLLKSAAVKCGVDDVEPADGLALAEVESALFSPDLSSSALGAPDAPSTTPPPNAMTLASDARAFPLEPAVDAEVEFFDDSEEAPDPDCEPALAESESVA